MEMSTPRSAPSSTAPFQAVASPSHSAISHASTSPSSASTPARVDPAALTAKTAGAAAPWTPRRVLDVVVHYVRDRDICIWIMTFAFVLLFFAYPIQGVQTIRYPATGSYILLILYGFYGITSLFATPVIDLVGPEFCMPLGALTYALFIASEFSGNNGLVLAGAAAFGWGAGLMWPAAGNILAVVSTPHNRGSNNGIFQMGFHLGVFSGGLTLTGVIEAFSSYDKQYSVFLGLCGASFITFIVFIFVFRARYRKHKPTPSQAAPGVAPDSTELFRVVHDDGSVEFRSTVDRSTLHNADVVVADLALTGGRVAETRTWTWTAVRARLWESIQLLWNPVFWPCALVVVSIGGVNQGWFNASFSVLANKTGATYVGWMYAIGESFGICSAILFGLFYDRLRKNYQPHQYRWVMYYGFVAVYAMCACAMVVATMFEKDFGDGPGQVSESTYRGMLILTCFFYSTSWLALELSIYTYLTTFLVYNADIGFSTKVFCEACGYMISYGLVDVLSPRWMVVVLFIAHFPAAITYLLWFRAPATPAPVLLNEEVAVKEVKGHAAELAVAEADAGKGGAAHPLQAAEMRAISSSQWDLVKGVAVEEEVRQGTVEKTEV